MNRTVSLWLVLFVIFLDWMGIGLVYPMFSTMLFHINSPIVAPQVSEAMRGIYLGLLLSAMPIAQFFSGPVLGIFSDQKGRRPLFLLSLLLGVIGYLFCMVGVLLGSIAVLVVSRFLVGIAAGNAAVVSATVADLSDSENKAKNFGLYSMACGVGFTIGPFLGGKFSETSFATPFLIAGAATLLNFFLVFFLFKETHWTRKTASIRLGDGIRNVRKAFQMPDLRALFFTILMFCFGWSFFYEFIPVTWIADYQTDAPLIGLFYAYGAGVYALSSGLLIRPIVSRYQHSTILLASLLLLGVFMLGLLSHPTIHWVWIYLPIFNFLVALVWPTFTTMVSDQAGKDAQGEILGLSQSIQSAAFALSPLIAGSALGANPQMPILLGGIAVLMAAFIFGYRKINP
jgi:DHA1 family tetracycline resistance protein-like MFS transporter